MRFDLFDCMNIMRKNFGVDSEILLLNGYPEGNGVAIRLRTFKGGELHTVTFNVSQTEIETDSYVDVANKKFGNAIKELRGLIT